MEEIHGLAKDYLQTKIKKEEQRRKIDYDFANTLKDLEKNHSTEGKLKVLKFKSQIQAEEAYFEELFSDLQSIKNEISPILQEINANRIDPLKTQVIDSTYIDTYLDENGEIISFGPYTKIN